ncbi:hypothetical protein BaRGS_00001053 [Batillaria attramentaria]|uniref:Uncharacterized protein n=1 Tax=Batillaria attramentaria TaxID=370345 RepID=A0ABD0M6K7_9CAEN
MALRKKLKPTEGQRTLFSFTVMTKASGESETFSESASVSDLSAAAPTDLDSESVPASSKDDQKRRFRRLGGFSS